MRDVVTSYSDESPFAMRRFAWTGGLSVGSHAVSAPLFPTRGVVRGFGDISVDNQRVITMEYINESATLIFTGSIIAAVTLIDASAAECEGSRLCV